MADRSASPSLPQPRKPPANIIHDVALRMVLNAAVRGQDLPAAHPTAPAEVLHQEALGHPCPDTVRPRALRPGAARPPRTRPDAANFGSKPPRPQAPPQTSGGNTGRVTQEDGRPPGRPPSGGQTTAQVRAVVRERLGRSMDRKADELKAQQDARQASAGEKRRVLMEAKRSQSVPKHATTKPQMPMVLRPVGFSSKGEAYQVTPSSLKGRPPSPGMRQRMDLLKAQKHKTSADISASARKQEGAQQRRKTQLEEKKAAKRKKHLKLPDQYTSTVLNPLKLSKDGEAYSVALTTRTRSPSPGPAVLERLAKPKPKEPEVIAAEHARRQSASAERRQVMLDTRKKNIRIKREDVARLCRERAAQLEASAAREAKSTQGCGKMVDLEKQEAHYQEYAWKVKKKLGLSEFSYPQHPGMDTAAPKEPTVGLSGCTRHLSGMEADLPAVVPPPKKVHSLMSRVTASWWMESPQCRQMAGRPSKVCFPPLMPPNTLTTHANTHITANKEPPESPLGHGKRVEDLYPAGRVEEHMPSPTTSQRSEEADDEMSVETISLGEEKIVPCVPTPSPQLLAPLPSPVVSKTSAFFPALSPSPVPGPVTAMCLLGQLGKLLPWCITALKHRGKGHGRLASKFLQNLKPCWKGRKGKVQPMEGPLQDMKPGIQKISDTNPAETGSTVPHVFKSCVRNWFEKDQEESSRTAKSSAPKPSKPYKTSKVKAIRIVDGEVIEIGDSKKGLRKLICWK